MVPKGQHVVNAAPAWTPAGQAFTDFLMQVFPLNHRLSAAGEALAKTGGQTLARWLVLEAIQGRAATVADIARAMGQARQGVQRLADLLVDNGDATYHTNPRHRRANLLAITPAGLASLRAIQHAQRTWADQLGEELGTADLERAKKVLERALSLVSRDLPALQTLPGADTRS
jgi:DNA-binding MarR family transcriptional regulator